MRATLGSFVGILAVTGLPVSSAAFSINVDFGDSATAPSPAYAAAGLAGTWNAVPALPATVRMSLVGLDGAATTAEIYQIGGSTMLVSDDAATAGNDEALLDDMFLSFNDPLDECVWFEGLTNGEYRVIIYALTPNDPNLLSRVRVDFATPGPVWIGGAWTGAHVEGLSYQSFDVSVFDGTIGLHSGVVSALIQSGINGIQVVDLGDVTSAALGDGAFDAAELSVFPNPARGDQTIRLLRAPTAAFGIEIVDVAGRLVTRREAPSGELVWDGRDGSGRPAPAGVYFVRALGEGSVAISGVRKLVRID
jgi:hypothetical protein